MMKHTRKAWLLWCLLPLALAYPLVAADQPQTAIVYLHGYCGDPDGWLPFVTDLEARLPKDSQSPLVPNYSAPSSFYYVRFDGSKVSYTPKFGDPLVLDFAGVSNIDTSVRVFLVDFYSPGAPTNSSNYALAVADVSIRRKGFELAEILADIKSRFGVQDFILIGHSMGGLVARAYLEGLALGPPTVAAGTDVRRLITIDTPHSGASSAAFISSLFQSLFQPLADIGVPLNACFLQPSINQTELDPTSSTMNSLVNAVGSISQDTTINSIVSHAPGVTLLDNSAVGAGNLCGQDDDSVVCRSEQSLSGRSNWTTIDNPYRAADLTNLPGCFNQVSIGSYAPNVLHLLPCLTSAGHSQSNVFDSVYSAVLPELEASFAEQSGIVGFIDAAVGPSGSATIAKGDNLTVEGWAADKVSGSPVNTVNVYIDGTLKGTATLGGQRSDVATVYGRSDYTYSGWNFQISTASLTVGSHTVTASAVGLSGTGQLLGTKTITISTQGGQEIGYVDVAGDSSGNATITKGGTLYVRGWAADTVSGAPVQSVTVKIDGGSVGAATLGGSRPDVAQVYGRSDYTSSGWNFQTSTGTLTTGSHSVSATVVGSSGTAQLGPKTITITTQGGQEVGYIDVAGDSTGNSTITKGSNLYVRGWAADTVAGAPVQSVTVAIDGSSVGTATLGGARPDVAQVYGRSDYTNSGWNFQVSTGTLSAGSHSITATAVGASGSGQLGTAKTISITTQGGQEVGYVDAAGDPNGVATVSQGNTLYVRGWAADTVSGAPVQSVTVFVDGSNVGTATLGGSRSDVAQFYGRSDYTNSGWNFQMSTGSLSVANHSITATAVGSSGSVQLQGSKTVTISNSTPNYQGYLDSATCSLIKGWVWDTTQPNTALQVDIYDGSTKIYSGVAANVFRQDLLNAGKGNGYHGFAFAPSGSLLNGGSHTLTAKVTGTSYTLQNTQTLSGCLAADFTFTTTTSSRSVQAGQQVGFDLSLTPTNNFTYPVTVFVSGLPSYTSVVNSSLQFSIGPTSGASFTLTLQTTGNTPAGTYTLTLQAQGGGINHYLYPSLTVTAPPPAPLSVSCYFSPNPITLGNGSTLFASASGGTGGYSYSLNGGSYQSGSSTTVLPSNGGSVSGSVTVKDSNNSTASNTCSLTVNGVAPSSITYYWDTQPIHGVPFSGYVYGNAFTPSAEVWFYGPGCTSGCKQPAGVTWQSLTSLRVVSIQLGQGSYQVEVRTAYGSARSGSFNVN